MLHRLIDFPPEWQRNVDGFGRRYASRDAAILTSNALEAGIGSMWGEGPRYFKCRCSGVSGRFVGNLWSEFWPDVSRHIKH